MVIKTSWNTEDEKKFIDGVGMWSVKGETLGRRFLLENYIELLERNERVWGSYVDLKEVLAYAWAALDEENAGRRDH